MTYDRKDTAVMVTEENDLDRKWVGLAGGGTVDGRQATSLLARRSHEHRTVSEQGELRGERRHRATTKLSRVLLEGEERVKGGELTIQVHSLESPLPKMAPLPATHQHGHGDAVSLNVV